MIRDGERLLQQVRHLHETISMAVVAATEQSLLEDLSGVAGDEEGDTIYAIDRVSEALLLDFFGRIAEQHPLILIAEGLPHGGQVSLPAGIAEDDAELRIIVDPIDGTRGLMYQKRSAWVLTGIAPNRGPATTLADIELAVQTEIPLNKQHLYDAVWAERGKGAHGERINRFTGERRPLALRPSRATSLEHGFGQISRFFPGGRAELAAIDDEVVAATLGPVRPGKAQSFEDQYISSGGQLYELMAGHDRWIADLRPLTGRGICSHPYDLCTELIAREAGIIITDERGNPLRAPLNISADAGWVGYANAQLRAAIEPVLQAALKQRGLLK